MHKINAAKCLIIIYIFIFGIFSKNIFNLAYVIFGRVSLMPQVYVKESHRSSMNRTSSSQHIRLMCCFHTKYLLKTLKYFLHFLLFH